MRSLGMPRYAFSARAFDALLFFCATMQCSIFLCVFPMNSCRFFPSSLLFMQCTSFVFSPRSTNLYRLPFCPWLLVCAMMVCDVLAFIWRIFCSRVRYFCEVFGRACDAMAFFFSCLRCIYRGLLTISAVVLLHIGSCTGFILHCFLASLVHCFILHCFFACSM